MTGLPSSSTYSSVVTRESVRIAFLITGLNDLDVLVCDIGNAERRFGLKLEQSLARGRDDQ